MKIYFTLFFLVAIVFTTYSQSFDLKPCGTFDHRSKWLKTYQSNPDNFEKTGDKKYVPLSIHLLGGDQGTGYMGLDKLLTAMCVLNEDFQAANIEFYIEGEINYHNNTFYDNHLSVLDGAEMMFEYNIENTINCYFLNDPAGNCGYNLPYAGMTVAEACANANDHTWSHEMGHQLNLPHPFLGWEGGISHDGTIPPNYIAPAPDTVLYDYTYFLDTLILDTMIVDTAVVERMDGTNCSYAADGFCDTSPDYLAFRWNCNGNEESLQVQHDPEGVAFQSDATLIMSYADDACSYRFSDEQINAMRANLENEKPELLYNQTPGDPVTTASNLYPSEGQLVSSSLTQISCDPVSNAIGYSVNISVVSGSASFVIGRYYSTSNIIEIEEDFLNGGTYKYEIRPFGGYDACQDFSSVINFSTSDDISSLSDFNDTNFQIYPTVLTNSHKLNISWSSNLSQNDSNVSYNIYDSIGNSLESGDFSAQFNGTTIVLEPNKYPKGMYFIKFNHGLNSSTTKRILIQ